MCSQFLQSCMILHEHCRFSLLSFFDEIENVDFCDWDWDCDWFWRIIALTCSTIFKFFLTTFLYSRIVFAKWTFFSIVFFCKIQLSQNVEVYFQSTIKNFSTSIVSKSKKFLMSKIKMRFWRFFQSITQISIWFLNDDCFNAWNFSCNYFFIWSSIFLYLMIKNCNIFFYENWHHLEENIRFCENTNCFVYFEHSLRNFNDQFLFSFVFFHICFIIFLLIWCQFMKSLSRTRMWNCSKNRLICHQIICYWLWIKILDWKMIDFEKNFFFKFLHIVIRIYILSHFDLQS
jgi:hypothetical protein